MNSTLLNNRDTNRITVDLLPPHLRDWLPNQAVARFALEAAQTFYWPSPNREAPAAHPETRHVQALLALLTRCTSTPPAFMPLEKFWNI